MKDLYIDFDGVILNTIEEGYNNMRKLGLDPKNSSDCGKYFGTLDWDNFISHTSQINNSIDNIQRIIDSNRFNVFILTHINSLDEAVAKVNYVRKYLKDITIIPVPRKISKTQMVHSENAILIDDYAGNLREWESAKGIGVRFSLKNNGKGFYAIDHLDEILDLVEESSCTTYSISAFKYFKTNIRDEIAHNPSTFGIP